MSDQFDPQRFDHWLLILTFIGLAGWTLWRIYGAQRG